MARFQLPTLLLLIATVPLISALHDLAGDFLRLPSQASTFLHDNNEGTRWAILIAGSNGYWNYRHQVIFPFPFPRFKIQLFYYFE